MTDIFTDTPEKVVEEEPQTVIAQPQVKTTDSHMIFYDVDLPSNGLLSYPKSIRHRDVMVKDEKMLSTSQDSNSNETMNIILKGLLEDSSKFEDMSVHDRDFLLVWIWANTYSPIREYDINCTSCGVKQVSTVDITKLDVNDLSDDYVTDFIMPLTNGDEIKLNLLSVRDERQVFNYMKANPKEDLLMVLMAFSITLPTTSTLANKLKYIENNVSGKEMSTIRAYHKYFKFGVDNTVNHNCTQCSEVTEFEFPFSVEYFLPTIQDDFAGLLLSNKKV